MSDKLPLYIGYYMSGSTVMGCLKSNEYKEPLPQQTIPHTYLVGHPEGWESFPIEELYKIKDQYELIISNFPSFIMKLRYRQNAIKKYVYHSFFNRELQEITNSDLYDTLEEAEGDMDNFLERFPTIDEVIIVPIYYQKNAVTFRGRIDEYKRRT